MALRSNLGTGPIAVLTTDTVLYQPGGTITRYHIGACNVFNTDAANTVTVSVYVSPDLTSASGTLVDIITVSANTELDVNAIVGQGETQNIIMVADIVGLNASLTRSEYDGTS